MESRPLLMVEEVLGNPAGRFAGDRTNTVVHEALRLFLEKYGTKGAEKIMLRLCCLITEVRQGMLDILAEQEIRAEAEATLEGQLGTDRDAATQKLRPVPGSGLQKRGRYERRGKRQDGS